MKRIASFVVVLVLLSLVLSACGGGAKPAAQPAPASSNQQAQKGNQPAKAQPTAVVSDEAALDQEPADEEEATEEPAAEEPTAAPADDDSLNLDSRAEGLDKLKSYRMTWRAEWKGTDSGKAEQGSWDWTEEFTTEPKALHWIWKFTDPSKDAPGAMEMWQVGDTTYMKTGEDGEDNGCMSFSSEDESDQFEKGLFSPNTLGSVSDARFVGLESINGIQAKHYKYDDKATTLAGMGKVNGEIWVAVNGGYVVKDSMTWQGAAGLFGFGGSDTKGEGKWTWELSSVDQPIDIKAPDNCGGGAKGLPAMSDAKEKSSFGDMTTYKTAAKLSEVVDFYNKEMPAAGWQPSGQPQTMDEIAMLEFSKDGQKASITITVDESETSVMINVTKAE